MLDRFKLPYPEGRGGKTPYGFAATSSEWKEIRKWQRENHPVRVFIWLTVPSYFRVKKMQFDDLYYTVRSWFLPYNVIKIPTLPRTYQEPFDVLLHGSFQVLVDFVEEEQIPFAKAWLGDEKVKTAEDAFRTQLSDYLEDQCHPDYEPSEEEIEALKHQAWREGEILDLYNWWKYERPLREKAEETLRDEWSVHRKIDSLDILDLDEDHPTKKEFRSYGQKLMRAEEFANKEDELQLIRLAKIRLHLWS